MTEPASPLLRQTWAHFAMRRVLLFILPLFFRVYGRWQIIGRENLPKTGAVLFAANHSSNLDPLVGWAAVGSTRTMWGIAKEELFRPGLPKFFMECLRSIPVKRGAADRAMFRAALEVLAQGETLGIFPEGTRTQDGKLNLAQPGFALIAQKSKAVVLPVAIIGTYAMLPRGAKKLRRVPLTVVFGTPISPETPRDQLGELVMMEIAALMTSQGHPTEAPSSQRLSPPD